MRDWGPGTTRRFVGLGLLAALIGVVTIVQGTANIVRFPTDSDLLVFFLPAAQRIVDGTPFQVYDVHNAIGALFEEGPLSFWWMAIPLGLGQALGQGDVATCVAANFGVVECRTVTWLVGLTFLPVFLLLAAAAIVAIRQVRPSLTRDEALLAATLVLFSPLLWLAYTQWWHFEQVLMLLFVVLGTWQLQRGRPVLAGVLFGLAMLTRPTGLAPIVSLLVLVAMNRQWRTLLTTGGAAALVVGLGILPYLVIDGNQTLEALVRYHAKISIGNSIWAFVRGISPIGELVRALDRWILLAATVAVAFAAARWRGVTATSPRAWGVMAIASLLVVLVAKVTFPYYYAEAFVFLVIWELSARSDGSGSGWRWPAWSFVYIVITMTLAQYMGLRSITDGGIVLRMMVVAQFVGIGVVAVGVWRSLREDPEPARAEVAPAATV